LNKVLGKICFDHYFQENDDVKRALVHTEMSKFEERNLRILIVGPVDSGKSSYIYSVRSALRGKIINDASERTPESMAGSPSSTTGKV
jgi:GTPase SAR1 family protein